MRYGPRLVPALARTPIGRRELLNSSFYAAWPLLCGLASAHRQTIGAQARVVAVVGSLGKTTTTRAALAALTGDRPMTADIEKVASALREGKFAS